MPGLGREDQAETAGLYWPILERRYFDADVWEPLAVTQCHRRHGSAGLKGKDVKAFGCERYRGLAGARSDFKGSEVRAIQSSEADYIVDNLIRVAGPGSVIQLRRLAEHESLLPHCYRLPEMRARRRFRSRMASHRHPGAGQDRGP